MGIREILGYGGRESDVAADILSEVDPTETSTKELVSTIDQKSESADVDPFDVAEKMADESAEVDQKIFGRIRERIRQFIRDPDSFRDREKVRDTLDSLDGVVSNDTLNEAKEQVANGNVNRARDIILDDPGVLEELGISEVGEIGDVGLFAEVDQNMNEENEQEGEENTTQLDMLKDEKRELLEEFAAEAGGDPEDYLDMLLSEGNSESVEVVDENGDYDEKMVTEGELDEKLAAHTEEVADAVVSDEVIDRIAGEVSQKMLQSEDFQEGLVETVDEKGDFGSTPTPSFEAPADGKTARDAILGGDN